MTPRGGRSSRVPGWVRIGAALAGVLAAGVVAVAGCALQRVDPAAFTIGQRTFTLRHYDTAEARRTLSLHERIHRHQYRRAGTLRFLATYALDRDQRLAWEAEAATGALCLLAARNPAAVSQGFEITSRTLTRYWIVRPIPIDEARRHLDRAFRNGQGCREGPVAAELRQEPGGSSPHSHPRPPPRSAE